MANCGSAAMKSGGEGGGGRGGGGVAYLLRQFETRIDAGAGVFERPPQKSILPGFVRGHRNVSNQVPTEPKSGGQSTSVVVVVALSSSSSLTKSSEQRSDPSMAPVAGNGKNSGTPSEGEEDSKAEGGCSSSQRTKTAEDNATEAANDEEKMSTLSSTAAQMDSSALRPPQDAISTHEETHRPGSDSDEHESNCRLHTKTECPFAAESGGGGGPQKLKKVARSVESLSNNSSAAANPTKDLDVFHVDGYTRNDKKTSDPLPPIAPATMSSGKSVPLLSNVKTPGVEKKPPPVPKKNPKVGRSTADEGDDAAGDSPDGSRVTSSSSSSPRVGESQTMPNLNQAKKSSRPTTLFPDDTSSGDDGGDGDRCKSLPLVSSAGGGGGGVRRGDGQQLVSIGVAQKNTLFPCNRHRNRGRIVSSTRETEERRGGGDDSPNSGDDDGDDFRHALLPQRSSADLLMSLGTTRPGSSLSPADQRTTEGVCAESSTETTTAAAVDASDWSAEAFESESFLSDTFDFLGSSSDSAECETNTSPLKSWAETWCRTNQRRISDAREKDLVNARGKTSSQDEKAVKAKPLQYGEPNRTTHMARIASSNCYEKSAFDNRSDESAETTPATRFGVVLRPKAASSSLVRRSSMAAASPSRESTSTLRASNVRPDSVVIDRPTSTIRRPAESLIVTDDDDDRTSFGLIRRKPSAVSTCSSILPLLVLPSQRTLSRTSAAGNTDARASAANRFRNSDRDSRAVLELGAPKDELDSELNAIDRAFNFLEDSGA